LTFSILSCFSLSSSSFFSNSIVALFSFYSFSSIFFSAFDTFIFPSSSFFLNCLDSKSFSFIILIYFIVFSYHLVPCESFWSLGSNLSCTSSHDVSF
jgi:hypothetical protein